MARDLMHQDDILAAVRHAYSAIPAGAGRAMAGRLYRSLAGVPDTAVEWSLGVGDPVRHAGLRPGEAVLDVGCGGGIDTVLAAREVGAHGHVTGLDMLAEMCGRARAAVAEAGVGDRCSFTVGRMEAMPLPDASVDVVISNGVLNLSPRKSRVLAEIFRVLRPGGRLCVADLTVEDDLPPEVLTRDSAWAGCISGALSERVFTRKLEKVGFASIELSERRAFGIDDVALYPLFDADVLALMRRTIPVERQHDVCAGVVVRARRPA
ncbi:2-methoxy-6-polyprenyl-1,4-benzoquinol methylase, mitochondrial [Actinosynnema sp. ALI-1.44]